MKRTGIKKTSKTETAKLKAKCDKLLTPIIKELHPYCEGCGSLTQVGHHWIEKSRSNNLRHEIDNIIPLCNSCHTKIHNRFGNSVMGSIDIADKVRENRGEDWFNRMKVDGRKVVKVNKAWYQENFDRLKGILDSLE